MYLLDSNHLQKTILILDVWQEIPCICSGVYNWFVRMLLRTYVCSNKGNASRTPKRSWWKWVLCPDLMMLPMWNTMLFWKRRHILILTVINGKTALILDKCYIYHWKTNPAGPWSISCPDRKTVIPFYLLMNVPKQKTHFYAINRAINYIHTEHVLW